MASLNELVDDNALIARAKVGDKDALNQLLERYSEAILLKAKTYTNINGIDSQDLYQEGLVGFVAAIYSYDESRSVKFSTYANTLAVREMISAIRKIKSNSNLPLQSYVCIEDITDLLSYLPTPEESFFLSEDLKAINDFVEENLSKSEKKVFKLNLAELSYSEIAEILDRDERFVDNALQRIRRKLRKIKL